MSFFLLGHKKDKNAFLKLFFVIVVLVIGLGLERNSIFIISRFIYSFFSIFCTLSVLSLCCSNATFRVFVMTWLFFIKLDNHCVFHVYSSMHSLLYLIYKISFYYIFFLLLMMISFLFLFHVIIAYKIMICFLN